MKLNHFLFATSIIFGTTISRSSALEKSKKNQNPIKFHGSNLEWRFHHHRDNQTYTFQSNKATSNYTARTRFNFDLVDGSAHIYTEGQYIHLDEDTTLSLSSMNSSAYNITGFRIVPLSNDTHKFYLHIGNSDPLVTPKGRAPFAFFRKSRYPDEPPAVFSVTPYNLNVTESYGGSREQIMPMAQLISELDHIDRNAAYVELLNLMEANGHLEGMEVFEFAAHLQMRTRKMNISGAFAMLPSIVQTLFTGGHWRLIYKHPIAGDLPMKNNSASRSHKFILPFTFTHTALGRFWQIKYEPDLILGIRYSYPSAQLEVSSSVELPSDFRFHLHRNQSTFGILYEAFGILHPLESRKEGDTFHFGFELDRNISVSKDGVHEMAAFHMTSYEFNVREMYEGRRENILKAARFVSSFIFVNKTRAYNQLVEFIKEYRHTAGSEVFELAQFIQRDLGLRSSAFESLPTLVQQIICAGSTGDGAVAVRLVYIDPMLGNMSVKSTSASVTHDLVFPYQFSTSAHIPDFAITYMENEQLFVPDLALGSFSAQLSSIGSDVKRFEFKLHLNSDLTSFSIYNFQVFENKYISLGAVPIGDRREFCFKIDMDNATSAVFTAFPYITNVTQMYGGKRENIIPTAKFIQTMPAYSNASVAFQDLLQLMRKSEHLTGKEIFEVAQLMRKSINRNDSTSDDTYKLLPLPVQLITNGEEVKVSYRTEFRTFPLKYSWASDLHENIKDFRFVYSEMALVADGHSYGYAINYNAGKYQLQISRITGELIDVRSKSAKNNYLFILYLMKDLEGIHILCKKPYSKSSLQTVDRDADFYFRCNSNPNLTISGEVEVGDVFIVERFN